MVQSDAVYLKRSQAYVLQGKDDLALDDLCTCLQVNEMCLEAHVSISKLHLKLGDVNMSIAACNSGLLKYASNQDLQEVLSQAVCVIHKIVYVNFYSMLLCIINNTYFASEYIFVCVSVFYILLYITSNYRLTLCL